MNDDAAFSLDQAAIARSFDRASVTYDAAARLQEQVRTELLERLDLFRLTPRDVLDLGTGTGHGAGALKRRHPRARVVALDIAPGMIASAAGRSRFFRRIERVRADAAHLPFANASFDIVFSNLMLQWCDLDTVFREVRRVLRTDGVFVFSTFGPGTLDELRASWAAVDSRPHVNRFIDMHDVGEAMSRAGLAEPVLDVDRHVLGYPDALELMRDLKAIGAHNVTAGRPRGLTGRRQLEAMRQQYEAFRRRDGLLPATYEVVFGVGWGRGEHPGGTRAEAGDAHTEFHFPAGSIRRRAR